MYAKFFGLKQEPFSIAPDPRYLFMSEQHREALAHLLYGVEGGGGFVLLTGDIGAGKTTVCRCFLEQIPRKCNVAYIFNPKLTVLELLKSVCDEFRIPLTNLGRGEPTVKDFLDPLNEFLLKTHAVGQNNVLIIDEAQNLSAEVLEQLRLLTNLETSERKLLQIILIGQPELRDMLNRPDLEQLAQRVIARFHLKALSEAETSRYIRHRLGVAGMTRTRPFDRQALHRIHQLSGGVPRRINLLCDRALLGAYADNLPLVTKEIVDKAASEVFDKAEHASPYRQAYRRAALIGGGVVAGAALLGVVIWAAGGRTPTSAAVAKPVAPQSTAASATAAAASAAASAAVREAAAGLGNPVAAAASDAAVRFKSTLLNEKDAWRELAPMWKLSLADGDPCQLAQKSQVQCFRTNGGLAVIRQLNRPGVLTLHDEGDRVSYALLTGLNEQRATLRSGDTVQTVPLVALARMWRGEFATFWRAPAGYGGSMADGSSGPAVNRLATQLAMAHGEPVPTEPQKVDAAMKSKVNAFQLTQGLKADGIAGPTTFMLLNRVTGVDEPRLAAVTATN
jgi:general secretion pathway protein A